MPATHIKPTNNSAHDPFWRTSRWYWSLILFAITAPGCKAPWQRQTSHEPSFDRLLEIEQAQGSLGTTLSQSRRPGGQAASDRAQRIAQANALFQSDENAAALDRQDDRADAAPVERDLLARTEAALRNSYDSRSEPPYPSSLASTTARKRISDLEADADADAEEPAVAFKMSDAGTLQPERIANVPREQRRPQQHPASSRRNISDAPTPSVLAVSDSDSDSGAIQDSGVVTASATRPVVPAATPSGAGESTYGSAATMEMTWDEHLRAAIAQLQESDSTASPKMQVSRAAKARLLNVAIGDLDAATVPIEGLEPNEQDYFRYQFMALADAIDPEGNPVASRRWSLTQLNDRKAQEHLAAASNLEVNNAAFCTEVDSFGVVTKFPEYKFSPDQELLLYCEVDNFISQEVKSGFETQLRGDYEIVDSSGRRVADLPLPVDVHTCRNRRRDYFITYHMYMPKQINPGQYTLKLTIEDMKGNKFGQTELDFQIVP
ncbi:MAG: hypothetical protein R3C53_01280 [Pirellulaceae bacterium]